MIEILERLDRLMADMRKCVVLLELVSVTQEMVPVANVLESYTAIEQQIAAIAILLVSETEEPGILDRMINERDALDEARDIIEQESKRLGEG